MDDKLPTPKPPAPKYGTPIEERPDDAANNIAAAVFFITLCLGLAALLTAAFLLFPCGS